MAKYNIKNNTNKEPFEPKYIIKGIEHMSKIKVTCRKFLILLLETLKINLNNFPINKENK
jgi:hypothetical protein